MKTQIIKKDGRLEYFNFEKIKAAVSKSADRIEYKFTEDQLKDLENSIVRVLNDRPFIDVSEMHTIVEVSLDHVAPQVAQAYRDYRNYKKDYAKMMESVLNSADELNYKIDRSNANTTAALISSQRSLIFQALSKEIYKKLFLSTAELAAIEDGYIYIHDLGSRAQTYNCCLFDMGKVLAGGFEWEHIGYNEPKDVRTAGNLISDITLNCAAQQYGGFTIAEIDSILAPYAEKSYWRYINDYNEITKAKDLNEENDDAVAYAMKKLTRDIEQVFQGFEHTFNTVASSRGDYPFVTMTGGCEENKFGQLVWSIALRVRREGQGKPGFKRPAIFPKLVFLYTEKLHGPKGKMHYLFNEGVQTSVVAMYPDWLSLDMPQEELVQAHYLPALHFEPSIAKVFHKYHKFGVSRWLLNRETNTVSENPEWVDSIVSPMGCRAYLSPYYERGKLIPADENDRPIFQGRFNGGAISLNLPMIFEKAIQEKISFTDCLKHYLDMIHVIHIKTYDFLCKLKASCNPVGFCEGGFGNLKSTDEIKPLIDRITFSYGFTALNELEQMAQNKTLYQASTEENGLLNNFAYAVEKYIHDYVEDKKKEYMNGTCPYIAAIYATPAESLCGTQVNQFKAKYGVIKGVSDKAYFTNSFHMWVGEEITPFEKQDAEFNYFHTSDGGHIQYCRFVSGMNIDLIKKVIERAMKLGYYFGVNIEKSYCGDCGEEMDDGVTGCPHCGSHNITTINRVCGYLGYSRIDGTSKMNDAKLAEIQDRKSM